MGDTDVLKNYEKLLEQVTTEYTKQKELHEKEGYLFNVFHLWNNLSCIGETIHSRLLHFLLTPHQLHGQGTKFLELFLTQISIGEPSKGEWHITAETGRVDIMLKRNYPKSVIVIENKSNWATDQSHQLYRYWYQNIHKEPDSNNRSQYAVVYLTPNDAKKPSECTLSKPEKAWFGSISDEDYKALPDLIPIEPIYLTFQGHIVDWLEECKNSLSPENTPLKEYLNQYQQYWKKSNMNETSLKQIFKTNDNWSAFVELPKVDTIKTQWQKKLQEKLGLKEVSADWEICNSNLWEIKWFIKGEGNSLGIYFSGQYFFRIVAHKDVLDSNKIEKLLKEPRFDAIKYCFDRIDAVNSVNESNNNEFEVVRENGNFHFGTDIDGYYPDDTSLAWFAGNRTEEFADQIMAKVKKLQKSEITALFKEISEKCRS